MSAADAAVPQRISAGRIVERTFALIGSNTALFVSLAAAFNLPVFLVDALAGAAQTEAFDTVRSVISALATTIVQAAIIHAATAQLGGRSSSFAEAAKEATSSLPTLIGIAFVYWIGVLGGLVLLIVPGLIWAASRAVAIPVFMVEHTSLSDALRRSRELTAGHRWPIFWLGIAYLICAGTLGVMSSIPVLIFADADDPASVSPLLGVVTAFLLAIASITIDLIGGAGSAAIYNELRLAKEGIAAEDTAAVFD
jgi:uncharacterized membrane protein